MSSPEEMMRLFDEADAFSKKSSDTYLRAPFGYPGGKSYSVKHIMPLLPYRKIYCEPFGGSAAILLARHPSPIEIYNDRYAGVVAFYRCMRDADKTAALIDRLALTVNAREEFMWSKATWENCKDDVERAARWYYITRQSFAALGRNWGRVIESASGNLSGRTRASLKLFTEIHRRFKKVQVENQDWYDCVMAYDTYKTVFYLDPPYYDASKGIYKNELSPNEHRKFIDTIFKLKGFCAVSGYANPLYDSKPWDERHTWGVPVNASVMANKPGFNKKASLHGTEHRSRAQEVLWIKNARI